MGQPATWTVAAAVALADCLPTAALATPLVSVVA